MTDGRRTQPIAPHGDQEISPCIGQDHGHARLLPMFNFIMAVAILGAVAFQVWLTITVFRSPAYEREQKIRQAQLIWLLPIVGATLVFSVLRESSRAEEETRMEQQRSARAASRVAQKSAPQRDDRTPT